jgi:hypothetical protein
MTRRAQRLNETGDIQIAQLAERLAAVARPGSVGRPRDAQGSSAVALDAAAR